AHLDEAKRFIRVLNDLGCQFALDDFGRELQSFTYLKQLNIHFLKLDGFYVRTIVEDEVNRAMVAAMIKLAHSLGMKVIAEQVESQAVLDILGELGADYAQGFAIENTHSLPI
ncbi:MAG: EAL domain-containing protein, partial [Gammaproteobacteria bacterium]|nr:EAL domain-containing protein [Gammaproteobacteria bacterium]